MRDAQFLWYVHPYFLTECPIRTSITLILGGRVANYTNSINNTNASIIESIVTYEKAKH